MHLPQKPVCLALLSAFSAGCSVVAPERDSANKLIGEKYPGGL
ncbi:hypothetical protein B0G80_5878 [Paraburkholderia sp. BL6669N2]|nr:hypothetical protein B0G80_5878 [Paraburkholderia sp. BL6669N2]